MDTEQVQQQITVATDNVRKKGEELKSDTIVNFISSCKNISEEYISLGEVYKSESEKWIELVEQLLQCVKMTIPADDANFKGLLEEIEKLETDIVKVEDSDKLKAAIASVEGTKAVIAAMAAKRDELARQKESECANRTVQIKASEPSAPTTPVDVIDVSVSETPPPSGLIGGKRRYKKLKKKTKKSKRRV